MEPKDLKNSEELKNTTTTGIENENESTKLVDEKSEAEINPRGKEVENLEPENLKEAPIEDVADSDPQLEESKEEKGATIEVEEPVDGV